MDPKMLKGLNEQLNYELASGYLYLSMSAWFEERNLPGFGAWFRVQALEEGKHAMRFFEYLVDRRERVTLAALATPRTEWADPAEAVAEAFRHEQGVTARIHALVTAARENRDYATEQFLAWFVNEQVEEEKSVDEVLQQLRMIGDSKGSLLMLDHRLGKRE